MPPNVVYRPARIELSDGLPESCGRPSSRSTERKQSPTAMAREEEEYLLQVIRNAHDVSLFSPEIARSIRDWTSTYHLSPRRANLLRPFSTILWSRVLEVGAGCGAVARFSVNSVANRRRRGKPSPRAHHSRTDEGSRQCRRRCRSPRRFRVGQPFDVITVIGVLEYSESLREGQLRSRAEAPLAPPSTSEAGWRPDPGHRKQAGPQIFRRRARGPSWRAVCGRERQLYSRLVVTFGELELRELLDAAGFRKTAVVFSLPRLQVADDGAVAQLDFGTS